VVLRIVSVLLVIINNSTEFFVILGYILNTRSINIILSGLVESLIALIAICRLVLALVSRNLLYIILYTCYKKKILFYFSYRIINFDRYFYYLNYYRLRILSEFYKYKFFSYIINNII
jgi:hypothetical protein